MQSETWPTTLLSPDDHFFNEKHSEWHLNACIGRQLPQDRGEHYYQDGFQIAARRLADLAVENGNSIDLPIDVLVYPIIFLYRHNIELLLKLLIKASRSFLRESTEKPEVGHRLHELWQTARPLLERCFDDADWSQNSIVSTLLGEFARMDPNGEAARYIANRKGEQHFAEMKLLHVGHFAHVADRLSAYLAEILSGIESTDELRREAERHYYDASPY